MDLPVIIPSDTKSTKWIKRGNVIDVIIDELTVERTLSLNKYNWISKRLRRKINKRIFM